MKPDYELIYENFDSPLMRQLRVEAYGEDIGQHSWVTAEDLRHDVADLKISATARLLDLGCGPCGPLTFLMRTTACSGIGLDLSEAALCTGRRLAQSVGIGDRLTVCETDLDTALPFDSGTVDAAISFDVVLHLRNRIQTFAEVARVLRPGGRFLFTDSAIVTGSITSDEVALRSSHGFTQFSAPGFNERAVGQVGFTLLKTADRTPEMAAAAAGRLRARSRHRAEVEQLEGADAFSRYQNYLQTIVSLSERRVLSRVLFVVERPAN